MALTKYVGERMTRSVRTVLLDIIMIYTSSRTLGHRLARSGMGGGANKGGGARYVPWYAAYDQVA